MVPSSDNGVDVVQFYVQLPDLPLILGGFLAVDPHGGFEVRFGQNWHAIVDESDAEILNEYGELIQMWCTERGVEATITQLQETLSNSVQVSERLRFCFPHRSLHAWADALAQLILP